MGFKKVPDGTPTCLRSRFWNASLLVLLVFALAPSISLAKTNSSVSSAISNSALINGPANVRVSPKGTIFFSLNDGVTLQIISSSGDWYRIRLNAFFDKNDFSGEKLRKGTVIYDEKGNEIGKTLSKIAVRSASESGKQYVVPIEGYTFSGNIHRKSATEGGENLGTLTEEDQKEFDAIGGAHYIVPFEFKNERQAIRYLRILVKGNEKTIKWYREDHGNVPYVLATEEDRKKAYDADMSGALAAINVRTNKESFKLAVSILETKWNYPLSMTEAAEKVEYAGAKSVIPLLRKVLKNPDSGVRLEAAACLLSLGDAADALPVLEKLADAGFDNALYELFSGPGRLIEPRGLMVVEKEFNNPKAAPEVRIAAINLLLGLNEITKKQAEHVAIQILEGLKNKTDKDYGLIGHNPVPKEALPGVNPNSANTRRASDSRACVFVMEMLARFKSNKAISILEHIKANNTDWWYDCWSADSARVLKIIKGQKK